MNDVSKKSDLIEVPKSKIDGYREIKSMQGTTPQEAREFWNKHFSEMEISIEEKQKIADEVAQKYNSNKQPFERAVEAGIKGVKKTDNGGVSFAETDSIYIKEDGTKCVTVIKATGKRSKDFDEANRAMGLDETPDGYVWHHVDDYNVADGTISMELVQDDVHNATIPHSGGCAQYDSVNGPSYNPPRKGGMN